MYSSESNEIVPIISHNVPQTDNANLNVSIKFANIFDGGDKINGE